MVVQALGNEPEWEVLEENLRKLTLFVQPSLANFHRIRVNNLFL